jgi:probable selenium-dependent hydroxylase accessory protein YqeC
MIDALWAEGLVDYLVVEADGSRGKSLKAFAAHEPQVPSVATTIVQVAGVDAAGRPLSEEYVHRADLLAAVLKVPSGVEMSSRLVAECLREQLRHLHRGWPDARLITLLNKVDRPADETRALNVARELSLGAPAPDAIVVASVRERRYARVDLVQAPRA